MNNLQDFPTLEYSCKFATTLFKLYFTIFHIYRSNQYNNLVSFNAFNVTVFNFLVDHTKNIITQTIFKCLMSYLIQFGEFYTFYCFSHHSLKHAHILLVSFSLRKTCNVAVKHISENVFITQSQWSSLDNKACHYNMHCMSITKNFFKLNSHATKNFEYILKFA